MKQFPLQTQREVEPGPREIPWSVAEIAYGEYSRQYGNSQTLERLAERGGFGWGEMDKLYPDWRKAVSEIEILKVALDEALKLMKLYAQIINQYDGGQRRLFDTSQEWIERLRETGAIK